MLAKRYWIAILCKIVVIIVMFLTTVFINRGLGVYLKGEYTYILRIVDILYLFLGFGIAQTYGNYKYLGKEGYSHYLVFLSIAQAVTILVIGFFLTNIFRIEHGLIILLLTALAIIKVALSMIAVIENSIKRNIIETCINIIFLLILITQYAFGSITLYNVVLGYAACEILRIIIISRLYSIRPKVEGLNREILYNIYKTGFITMSVMVLTNLNYAIDTVMLKNLSSSYFLGLYSVAITFSNMFLIIPDALKEVIFGDSTKKDFNKKLVYSSIRVSILFAVLILALFILVGKNAIVFLYGDEYTDTYLLTIICFIGSLSLIFFKILHPIYISHGIQKRAVFFLVVSVILNILLNLYLIPKYQAIGASIASALSHLICGGLFMTDFIINFRYK